MTEMKSQELILEIRNLSKHFIMSKPLFGKSVVVHAVDDVSLQLKTGETLGLVGESGSGKTTVGRCILRLVEPTSGEIIYRGMDIRSMSGSDLTALRKEMQMVFQDPADSLNPRFTIRKALFNALEHRGYRAHQAKLERSVALLEQVGLDAADMEKYPHQFSGGQQQRVALARALALEPRLIFLDEPTASLDVSVQSQVLSLFHRLQQNLNLSYVLISHDLSSIRHYSHQVAVMYLGKLVETGSTETLFSNPKHPYTKELMDAVPVPDPFLERDKFVLQGEVPSPIAPPPGCRFHTRCPIAVERCSQEVPALKPVAAGHMAACHLIENR